MVVPQRRPQQIIQRLHLAAAAPAIMAQMAQCGGVFIVRVAVMEVVASAITYKEKTAAPQEHGSESALLCTVTVLGVSQKAQELPL